MATIIHDEGELSLLAILRSGTPGWAFRLFKNNFTPVATSVLGDFTEADFSGYSIIDPAWAAAAEVSGKAEADATTTMEFVHNGGGTANNIYGWFLVNTTDNTVVASGTFAGSPLVMDTLGDKITLDPCTIQLFG